MQGALNEFAEVHRAPAGSGRPREVHQVLHNLGRAPRLLMQNAQLLARGFARFPFLGQFSHPQDAGQRIVELVGEPSDHLAHGGQAFALNDLLLESFFHRDVMNGNDHARRFAFRIEETARPASHGAPGAVVVPRAILGSGGRLLAHGDAVIESHEFSGSILHLPDFLSQ